MVYLALTVAVFLTVIDQLLKLWAVNSLSVVETVPLLEDVFHLTFVKNYGAAFSILQNKTYFLVTITAVAILGAMYLIVSKKVSDKLLISGISLVISGGVGNLIDRVTKGYVVDFLDFRLINFPVFNFADVCVVVGTGLILLYVLFFEDKNNRKKSTEN